MRTCSATSAWSCSDTARAGASPTATDTAICRARSQLTGPPLHDSTFWISANSGTRLSTSGGSSNGSSIEVPHLIPSREGAFGRSMMRGSVSVIAVTGVAGYLGRRVIELLESDESVQRVIGVD